MNRIYVMELVRSFQVGQLTRRDFEEQAAAALGSLSAAHMLLAACDVTSREAPPVILKEPEASLTWSFESAARSLLLAETAEYPDLDGETLTGYLARPVESGRRPAVVVIQTKRASW